jgi:uncharacterized protein (TIGR02145 family)
MIHPLHSVVFFAISTLAASASAVSLSGRVLSTGATPVGVPGVTVTLTGASLSTLTDAQGEWSLGSVGVTPRVSEAVRPVSRHLVVDQGHVRVALAGRDLLGRGAPMLEARPAAAGAARAGRTLAGPDTLVYAMGGKVFLRDTLTHAVQSGIERVFDTTWNPDVVYGYLKDDRDGQMYRTVRVGYKDWMAQNLNYEVDSSWCPQTDPHGGCAVFGRLYSWSAVLGVSSAFDTTEVDSLPRQLRGVCPAGWHVPDTLEWSRLGMAAVAYKPNSPGGGAALRSRPYWGELMLRTANPDPTGFRALPTVFHPEDPDILKRGARFWALQEFGATAAWGSAIYPDWTSGGGNYALKPSTFSKSAGISLRCARDR